MSGAAEKRIDLRDLKEVIRVMGKGGSYADNIGGNSD
jgi:hypothetical protein